MALFLDVLPGESVSIGSDTRITIEEKTGKRTRLRIESPQDVRKTVEPVLTPPARTAETATASGPPVLTRRYSKQA